MRSRLVLVRKSIRYWLRFWRLYLRLRLTNQPVRIILGAAETAQPGWFSTNENWLDISRIDHWERLFQGKAVVSNAVAEHVMEHLADPELERALTLVFNHLQMGGTFRIAVPDGGNPNPDYIRHVEIMGVGDDAADHKQLFTSSILKDWVEKVGFESELIEGYDEIGNLINLPVDAERGRIRRSRSNESKSSWSFPDAQTSLIVDATRRS
ncbi:MAG: hypothetical protein AAGA96_02995 [Verrucomicrobiota bacterium]